jgi:hypothetical protein
MDFYLFFEFVRVTRLWITLAPAVAATGFPHEPLIGADRQAAGA